jgi:hypothetical protein
MNKEMEVVLIELLNFFALEGPKRIEVFDQISEREELSFKKCAAKLTEQLRDYCTYRVIDPQKGVRKEVEQQLEELHSLANLMLQSQDQELWSRDSIARIGVWSLLSRLAFEASHGLGETPTGVVDVARLRFHIQQ